VDAPRGTLPRWTRLGTPGVEAGHNREPNSQAPNNRPALKGPVTAGQMLSFANILPGSPYPRCRVGEVADRALWPARCRKT